MKIILSVSVLLALSSMTGCMSAAITKHVEYSTTSDRALECAMGAARDIGLKIESSDSKMGVFSAVKMGTTTLNQKDMANYQASFAVDKQTKSVQVDIQSFGQLMPGDEIIAKMTADFQAAFKRRCV